MILYKDNHTTVFQSALFQTTSTVVETPDFILVADPCWLPQEVESIRRYVDERKEDRPVYLLFTHSDYDHIIGYNAFPGSTVIGSGNMAENTEKEEIINQILRFDDSYYLTRNYKIAYPETNIQITENGQKLQLGDYTLTFYHAKGHTNDGIYTIIEPLGLWIAGDFLSDIEFPYIYSSSYDYEATLETSLAILGNHNIKLLVPGHGSVASNYPEINKRIKDSQLYIENTRKLLCENKEEQTYMILRNYSFPHIMKKFHEGNIELMKKELGK